VVFSSVIFIFYFLPVFLLGYYVSGWRTGALLVGSTAFYAWGEGAYLFLLLGSLSAYPSSPSSSSATWPTSTAAR
jgi:alginate O-acetyltransferase complex protein AlgI